MVSSILGCRFDSFHDSAKVLHAATDLFAICAMRLCNLNGQTKAIRPIDVFSRHEGLESALLKHMLEQDLRSNVLCAGYFPILLFFGKLAPVTVVAGSDIDETTGIFSRWRTVLEDFFGHSDWAVSVSQKDHFSSILKNDMNANNSWIFNNSRYEKQPLKHLLSFYLLLCAWR
jgi:hypothetical protein